MTVDGELGETWEEAGIACAKALFQYLPVGLRKTLKDLSQGN